MFILYYIIFFIIIRIVQTEKISINLICTIFVDYSLCTYVNNFIIFSVCSEINPTKKRNYKDLDKRLKNVV